MSAPAPEVVRSLHRRRRHTRRDAAPALLFSRCFPRSRTPFSGFRSWSSGRPRVEDFYARGGWVRVADPTRMVRSDGTVQVYGGVSMVLPVLAPMSDWPAGPVDRNGLEV